MRINPRLESGTVMNLRGLWFVAGYGTKHGRQPCSVILRELTHL